MYVSNLSMVSKTGKCLLTNICFTAKAGEILFVTGKSGAGKSSLLKGISSVKATINMDVRVQGTVAGIETLGFLYQNSKESLSPAYTILAQAVENIGLKPKAMEWFTKVGLASKVRYCAEFLSGGQRALANLVINMHRKPTVLLLDEPTANLDEDTTKNITGILQQFVEDTNAIVIWVSHDLQLARDISHRVLVIDKGHLVEDSKTLTFFNNPKSTAGKDLVNSKPLTPSTRIFPQQPVCSFKNVSLGYGKTHILRHVSFCLHKGETLGVFGKSGVGKTTILRALLGQIPIREGIAQRPDTVQMIFQDARGALNPRRSVFSSVAEPLLSKEKSKTVIKREVYRYLSMVDIDTEKADSFPEHFSGGECQRICIARAMISQPRVLLADEITSSLDTYNTHRILKLLIHLQQQTSVAIMCVSHNRAVLSQIAHSILQIQ